MQSRRSRVPGNNLLTAEVDSRRKKRAQQGKMFSSLVWDEESSIVVQSAENGEIHEDLPWKEGEQDDLGDLQCRRLCRPRNTLLLAPRALGRWVEGCGVMWCNDFSESVAKVLWNQWVLFSFKWWCLLKVTCICGYFNMFRFRCFCTVLTGTLPLEHLQAPFYPLANIGSPLCPLWNPVTQSFWSISRRTLTWGYFTAEKNEKGSKFHSAVGSLAARQHSGNQKEVVEVCSTSWWKSNGNRALAKILRARSSFVIII